MTDLEKIEEYFDNTLKPLVEQVLNNPDLDSVTKHYIGQVHFYIEHDLADGRMLNSIPRLGQARDVMRDSNFFKAIYKGKENSEVVKQLKELGEKITEFMGLF